MRSSEDFNRRFLFGAREQVHLFREPIVFLRESEKRSERPQKIIVAARRQAEAGEKLRHVIRREPVDGAMKRLRESAEPVAKISEIKFAHALRRFRCNCFFDRSRDCFAF